MQFQLTIELGNAAMQSGEDVAEALNRAADRLWLIEGALRQGDEGPIFDMNGNKVGEWRVTE